MTSAVGSKTLKRSVGLKYVPEKILLGVFAIYLVAGNLARIIGIGGLTNNLPLTEIALYLSSLLYIVLRLQSFARVLPNLYPVCVIVLLSMLHGIWLNGLELLPLSFALRLIAFFVSGAALACALARYKKSLLDVLNWFVKVYLILTLVSLVIYVAFPDSTKLWLFLSSFGVTFKGDPHQNRLVSSYLDPNYWGAIAVLPFLMGLVLLKVTRHYRYLFFSLLVALSIVLSVSRSGLVTFVLALTPYVLGSLARFFKRRRIRSGFIILAPLGVGVLILGSRFYIGNLTRVLGRIQNVATDPSALARLETYRVGWSIFTDQPLLGVGYNYLSLITRETLGRTAADSSVLTLLATFGLILSLTWLALYLYWFVTTHASVRAYGSAEHKSFFFLFNGYFLVCFVFTSQFNNLLFYQFWALPMITLGIYFTLLMKLLKRSPCQT